MGQPVLPAVPMDARIHAPVWPRTLEHASQPTAASGGVSFGSGDERVARVTALVNAGWAVVELRPSPLMRGRLADAILTACDALLVESAAPPPGMGDFGSVEDRIRDRLFRAHRIGKRGLALVLASLGPLARLGETRLGETGGVLAPEDGETLTALSRMNDRLAVLLEARDETLAVFRAPVPLVEVLKGGTGEQSETRLVAAPPAATPTSTPTSTSTSTSTSTPTPTSTSTSTSTAA